MPKRFRSAPSVAEMMTEKKASQPRSSGSPASTRAATSLVAEVMESAMSVSSGCSRGFLLPSCWV